MNYYCIACKVSKELTVKKDLEHYLTKIFDDEHHFQVLFATKQYKVKNGKSRIEVKKPLTPGYIFIKIDTELDKYARELRKISDCYGLVESKKIVEDKTDTVCYKLMRDDLKYATWIFSNDGEIIPSKITLNIGTSVCVISGPLATFNGKIIKVDKRNNKVCLFSENSGTLQKVWVPVEIVKEEDLDSNDHILKEFSKVY